MSIVDLPLEHYLVETDGEPLETDWHRWEITLLCELVNRHLWGREDYYVGGNMFIYFSEEQIRTKDYRGPDFFFVWGVPRHRRLYWLVWEENDRYPDVIIELSSPSTVRVDYTTKKDLYERVFRTHEYYCYDWETQRLDGWRLDAQGRYQAIVPNDRGWLWCEELQLWLGPWTGTSIDNLETTWLRFYDAAGNLVRTGAEAEHLRAETERKQAMTERQRAAAEHLRAESERQQAAAAQQRAEAEHARAEMERQQAEMERQRAEAERGRAEAERGRAEAERQRAEAAEAELARLRAAIASQKPTPEPPAAMES